MGVGEASYILELHSGYVGTPYDHIDLGFVYEWLVLIFSFDLGLQEGFNHLDDAVYFPCLNEAPPY